MWKVLTAFGVAFLILEYICVVAIVATHSPITSGIAAALTQVSGSALICLVGARYWKRIEQ